VNRSKRKARRRGQLQIDSEQVIPGFRREYVYGEGRKTMGIDVIRYDRLIITDPPGDEMIGEVVE